jgi:hypothetical protein
MGSSDEAMKPIAYLCVGRRADGTKCETTAFTEATATIWPEAHGFVSHYTVPLFSAPRWIPVEERMPEKGVDVLVASPCPNSNVPNIDIASWGSEGEQEPVWRESDCGRIYPTHWMSLPAPPTE